MTIPKDYINNGSPDTVWLTYWRRLIEKHKNFCLLRPVRFLKPITWEYEKETAGEQVVPWFYKELNRCMLSKKRFIVIPIGLGDREKIGNINILRSSHSNVILIDNKTKTIEYFEPHGSPDRFYMSYKDYVKTKPKSSHYFSNWLKQFFKNLLPNYKFLETIPLGPQHIEKLEGWKWKKIDNKWETHKGFCGFWTMWYIDLRLTHPEVPRNQLIKDSYKILKKHGFINFIEEYAYSLEQLTKKEPFITKGRPIGEIDWEYQKLTHTAFGN